MNHSHRIDGWLRAAGLAVLVAPATARGQSAAHDCAVYRSPGTNTVSCQFAYPATNQLWSLLWRPGLPAGWSLLDAAGHGAPEVNAGEIVFTGALTNRPVRFNYRLVTPAGETVARPITGQAEYTLNGMLNPATVDATPDPLTVAPLGTLTVTSPNGAETNQSAWLTGLPYPVTWNVSGVVPGAAVVQYSLNAGASWNTITGGVSLAAGRVVWRTPPWESVQTLVRVVAESHPDVWDASDRFFHLARRYQVVAPNGGETLYIGATNPIVWHAAEGIGAASLDFSGDGTWTNPTPIASFAPSAPATRSNAYAWAISTTNPAFVTLTGRVRVQTLVGRNGDTSDAGFRVAGAVIVAPATGQRVKQGSIIPVRWRSAACGPTVRLDIQTAPGGPWDPVATNITNWEGMNVFPWTVTNAPAAYARLRLISNSDPNARGWSRPFVIDRHVILATAGPNGQIAPNGAVAVAHGGVTNLVILPNPAYHVADVLVNGRSVGPTNAYRFANVTSNQTIHASFAIDRSNLVVRSHHGVPTPSGVTPCDYGALVRCTVAGSPVTAPSATQYVCRGWVGTGSVPSAGAGTNVLVTVTNDSTLTWVWGTNYWLATATAGSGTVDRVGGWRAAFTTLTVTATAAAHHHFVRWSGDTNECLVLGNRVTAVMDRHRALTAHFAVDLHTLQVRTPHGLAAPPAGANPFPYATTVRAALTNSPVHHGALATQYVCRGWALAGNAPAAGATTNTGPFALTNNATLSWLWTTNVYLDGVAGPSGRVDVADGWFRLGTNLTVTAVPTGGYHFVRWFGDVPPGAETNNPLPLAMTQSRRLNPRFALNRYPIQASAGPNGTISPTGTLYVTHGGGTNYVFQPDANHHVLDVVVNGVSLGPTNAYAFRQLAGPATIHVTFALDASFSLAVRSPHGAPTPFGVTAYFTGTPVPCALAGSPVLLSGVTQYICRGWAGTGSVQPPTGTGTNLTVTVTSDSTLVWLWRTNFFLTVLTNGNGRLSATSAWHRVGTNVTLTATPDAHHRFVRWSGDTGGCAVAANRITSPMRQARRVTAHFAIDRFTLQIRSAHGGAVPLVGVHTNDWGQPVPCAVTHSPVFSGGTQYVARGWTGTGSVQPPTGIGTNLLVTITNHSTLTWTWRTNYWLDTHAGPNGQVFPADRWVLRGSNATLTAVPDDRYHLARWVGDVPPGAATNNPLPLAIRRATVVTALFAHAAAILRVDAAARGANNGRSWADAFTNLQDALAYSLPGDQIWVAAGRYSPGPARTDSFGLRSGVTLYGGFAGTESDRAERNARRHLTLLSGDVAANDVGFSNNTENAHHVVLAASDTALDGFVIAGGNADGDPSTADGQGGGLRAVGVTNLLVTNCVFVGHFAGKGGGLYAAASRAHVRNCDFLANRALVAGGAAANEADADVRYLACRFAGNRVSVGGGALFNEDAVLLVANSTFSGNRANGAGGGVNNGGAPGSCALANLTFRGNAANYGGALFNQAVTETTVASSIFWGNAGLVAGPEIWHANGTLTLNSCDVQAGRQGLEWFSGAIVTNGATLDLDPLFAPDLAGAWSAPALRDGARCRATFTHAGAGWTAGALVDRYLWPDTNAAPHYLIVSNGADTVTVWGVPDDPAFAGRPYRVLDSHLRSTAGRWDPAGAAWRTDPDTSPCVDAGHPSQSYANEPLPNGRRVNMGAHGNTAEASLSGLSIVALPPAAVSALDAIAQGRVLCTRNRDPRVWLVWGTTDGGTNFGNWQRQVDLGRQGLGRFTAPLAGLASSTTYHYRFYATNAHQSVWAPATVAFTTAPAVLHVDGASPVGGDGSDWTRPFTNLTQALGAAVAGQTLWVARGLHTPGAAREDAFLLKNGVSLLGGFTNGMAGAAQRAPAAFAVVLSGEIGDPALPGDNSYHVVIAGSDCRLDGVTVRGGYAVGAPDGDRGAGLDVRVTGAATATLWVANCRFERNLAAESGGAIHVAADGSNAWRYVVVSNCAFVANEAWAGQGGALRILSDEPDEAFRFRALRCTFASNLAASGGAIALASPVSTYGFRVADSRFVANRATAGSGGALLVAGEATYASMGFLSNCVFAANEASLFGGAADLRRFGRPIGDCRFVGNSAGSRGGALRLARHRLAPVADCVFAGNQAPVGAAFEVVEESPEIVRGLIVGNEASTRGGVHVSKLSPSDCRPRFLNCTFSENAAPEGGALSASGFGLSPVQPALVNCILWNDAGGELLDLGGGAATGRNNCVEGGMAATASIAGDPLFVAPQTGAWTAEAAAGGLGLATLTDAHAAWTPGALAGLFVQFDTNDVRQFLVASNDARTVTVWGDLSLHSLADRAYRIHDYRLGSTNSPCIDAGVFVGLPYRGRAPDIGAREWGFVTDLRVLLQGPHVADSTMASALGVGGWLPPTSPYSADPRTVAAIPTNIVDWVLIECRATNGALVRAQSALLRNDGRVVRDTGEPGIEVGVPPGSYRVAVKHRNHLAALSATLLAFDRATVAYDFTDGSNRFAGGVAAPLGGGRWGLWAGDADGDGIMRPVDRRIAATQMGRTGYRRGDFDLDGLVEPADTNVLWATNAGRASGAAEPATVLTAALTLAPPRKTSIPGEWHDITAFGATGTVHWAFVDNASGANLAVLGSSRARYVAGATAPAADTLEAWDVDNRLVRSTVHLISAASAREVGKAIVVAGSRGAGDLFWPATHYLAERAHEALLYRGYSASNVLYLSAGPAQEADAPSTFAALAQAVTNWVGDRKLFLYLVDHGGHDAGDGYFQLNDAEALRAETLDGWLDALQSRYTNEVVVVVDCCQAGYFVHALDHAPPPNRIVVTACAADQPTWFLSGGLVSFSEAFLSAISEGLTVWEAFGRAAEAMAPYQTPWLDDDGDAAFTAGDGLAAAAVRVGVNLRHDSDLPVIGSISGNQALSGVAEATLWVGDISAKYPLARVWCQILPPGYNPDPSRPVGDAVNLELDLDPASGRYTATHAGFMAPGFYTIVFYAMDNVFNVSQPRQCFVEQSGYEERALVVVGGVTNSPDWSAWNRLGCDMYRTLRARGFGDDSILFLSAATNQVADGYGTNDVDARPSAASLAWAFTNWAADADRLSVALIGDITNRQFILNAAERLAPADLDSRLDAFQGSVREAFVLLECPDAGAMLPALRPPSERARIVLAGCSAGRRPCLANTGMVSLTRFFLSETFNGDPVGPAFERAAVAIREASGDLRQQPLLDDDGDGAATAADGSLAAVRYFGNAFAGGADAPVVGAVNESAVLVGSHSLALWASNVVDADGLGRVWVVITPPAYPGTGLLAETELAWNDVTRRHEGTCSLFSLPGSYVCTFLAADTGGEVSPPRQCRVTTPDAYEPDDTNTLATAFPVGSSQAHNFHRADDADWIRFLAVTGQVYQIEAEPLGTNAAPRLEIFREDWLGGLEPLSHLATESAPGQTAMAALDFLADSGLPVGMYCVRVTTVGATRWGTGSDYALRVYVPAAGDKLLVAALDVTQAGFVPPAGAAVVLDGLSAGQFGGVNTLFLTGLSPTRHTVQVTAGAGYWPAESPAVSGAVASATSANYGNPRAVDLSGSGAAPAFMFYAMARANGTVRNADTGDRVASAALRFTASAGPLAGQRYTNYQGTAWGSAWRTGSDGGFPSDRGSGGILLPAAPYHLLLSCAGYASRTVTAAIATTPAAGDALDLGDLFLAPLDTNGNGIADEWEQRFFGSNVAHWVDSDGDGAPNLHEYLAGTDPTNAASALRCLPPAREPGGQVTLNWWAVPDRDYRVRVTENLLASPWPETYGPWRTNAPGVMRWTDSRAPSGANRYYRIQIALP